MGTFAWRQAQHGGRSHPCGVADARQEHHPHTLFQPFRKDGPETTNCLAALEYPHAYRSILDRDDDGHVSGLGSVAASPARFAPTPHPAPTPSLESCCCSGKVRGGRQGMYRERSRWDCDGIGQRHRCRMFECTGRKRGGCRVLWMECRCVDAALNATFHPTPYHT